MSEIKQKAVEDFDHIRKRLEEIRVLEGREPPKGWQTPSQVASEAGSPMGWADIVAYSPPPQTLLDELKRANQANNAYSALNAFTIKNWQLQNLRETERSPADFNDLWRWATASTQRVWWKAITEPTDFPEDAVTLSNPTVMTVWPFPE